MVMFVDVDPEQQHIQQQTSVFVQGVGNCKSRRFDSCHLVFFVSGMERLAPLILSPQLEQQGQQRRLQACSSPLPAYMKRRWCKDLGYCHIYKHEQMK
jgi:hypothetical protein